LIPFSASGVCPTALAWYIEKTLLRPINVAKK